MNAEGSKVGEIVTITLTGTPEQIDAMIAGWNNQRCGDSAETIATHAMQKAQLRGWKLRENLIGK